MTREEIEKAFKKYQNNQFEFILGGRSNGKKYVLEQLGYKVITRREFEQLRRKKRK